MQPVERAEYEGVDYAWVMQTTFVVTILVGAPAAALLSTLVTLESWGARAAFAVRVGAPIWFVTAVAVALYAKRAEAGDGGADTDEEAGSADDATTDDDSATDDAATDDAATDDAATNDDGEPIDDGEPADDDEPTTNEAGKGD